MLVFGSLPPEGRDLDLLARPAAEAAITALLAGEGLVRRGAQWALFAGCTAFGIELVPAGSWGLPPGELERLFSEAAPLERRENLVEPAPRHALLIAARKNEGRLDEKLRRRVAAQLERDPAAWDEAAERAEAWGAGRALRALRQAYDREDLRGRHSLARVRQVVSRPRRGRVVAFSGLDGAGKSSQAQSLRQALEQLGIPTAVVWTPLASNRSLRVLAAPVKRFLKRGARGKTEVPSLVARPGAARAGGSPLGALLAQGWTTVVAVTNGCAQLRASLPHLLRGRVVIFDRYLLDSAVHLRYLYGDSRSFRLQNGLIAALSPNPVLAYFLEVEPETVVARKPIQYELDHVRKQAQLYLEEHARRNVKRLDGERPREELCAEIAAEVWSAL